MGLFSWLSKKEIVLENWEIIVPGNGALVDLFDAALKKAQTLNLRPILLFSSGMDIDRGSTAIRKYRPQMDAAYSGIYIIDVRADEWDTEDMKALGFFGKFPYYAKIGADNKPTKDIITGDAWGEDTLENMTGPIQQFLQGHS